MGRAIQRRCSLMMAHLPFPTSLKAVMSRLDLLMVTIATRSSARVPIDFWLRRQIDLRFLPVRMTSPCKGALVHLLPWVMVHVATRFLSQSVRRSRLMFRWICYPSPRLPAMLKFFALPPQEMLNTRLKVSVLMVQVWCPREILSVLIVATSLCPVRYRWR